MHSDRAAGASRDGREPRLIAQSPHDPRNDKRNDKRGSPPDLDELWRDFNRRLNGLFKRRRGFGPPRGPGGFQASPQGFAVALSLLALALMLAWIGSGFFVVRDGERAVVTHFGRATTIAHPGLHWRLPYPIDDDRIVDLGQLRSIDVGSGPDVAAAGVPADAALTADQAIVNLRFGVQYRVTDPVAYLYAQRDPAALVHDAAADARRAVLGGMTLKQALSTPQDRLADALRKRIGAALERAHIGVALVDVTLKGVRVPNAVQAAFDDEQKAQQQREALQRDAKAYAADVVPRAQVQAAQMVERAQVYAQRVVTQAQGDSARFDLVLKQYRKAPEVTREALYLQTMQDILGRVTKVVVPHGSVIQLPAPKPAATSAEPAAPPASAASAPAPAASLPRPSDSLRDSLRERAFR